MPLQVPIPRSTGEAHITWVTQLEGVDYRFTLLWVERQQGWYLTLGIASPAQDLLVGVRLCLGVDFLASHQHTTSALPSGVLRLVTQVRSDRRDPDFEDLGDTGRVQLLYWTEEELEAAS